ncbi:MAG: RimK family alpha-L-glutamate ligase [Natronomonas sp.]
MLRLAVATDAETLRRIGPPLADRGIEAEYVPTRERTVALEESSEERLGSFDVGFVFPPRVMEGGVADALLDIPWVNDRVDILRSRNKAETLARLQAAGIPTPRSVYVSNPVDRAELVDIYERFEPPVVVKPNSATRGIGVAKAADLDSFLGICDYLELVHDFPATGDRSFLVQEYLPDARDYRAMVVGGEYAGAVERRLSDDVGQTGQWKHNVHRGAHAVGVELPPERQSLVERTANALEVEWLGVDLLLADDRVVVSETNARPTVDAETKYEPGFYDRLEKIIRDTTP